MTDPNNPDRPEVPQVPGEPQAPGVPGAPPAEPPTSPPGPPAYGPPTTPPADDRPMQQPPAYGTPTPPPPASAAPGANPYPPAGEVRKPAILSILSLVAGIIGIIGSPIAIIPFVGGIMAMFLPAAAVVLGFLGKSKEPQARGLWLTGIITGFVGFALALLSLLIWGVLIASTSTGSLQ